MARGVLVAALVALAAGHAGAAELHCAGPAGGAGPQLSDAKMLPLYALLAREAGAPRSCRIEHGDDGDTVTVTFAGGSLRYGTNEAIESSAQEAQLSVAHGLSPAAALQVLKAAEVQAVGAKGCGIDWSALASLPRDGEGTADGTACSCKARLRSVGGRIIGLGLSLAC